VSDDSYGRKCNHTTDLAMKFSLSNIRTVRGLSTQDRVLLFHSRISELSQTRILCDFVDSHIVSVLTDGITLGAGLSYFLNVSIDHVHSNGIIFGKNSTLKMINVSIKRCDNFCFNLLSDSVVSFENVRINNESIESVDDLLAYKYDGIPDYHSLEFFEQCKEINQTKKRCRVNCSAKFIMDCDFPNSDGENKVFLLHKRCT